MAEDVKIFYFNHYFPPVHYIQILIPKGTFSEPIEKKGVMECLAGNLFLYSKKYEDEELKPFFDILGASADIEATEEYTSMTLQVVEDNFEKAVKLLFDSFFNPEFNEKKFKSFKKGLIGALKISLTDPQFISECHLFDLVFGKNHPLGKNQTISTIKKINIEDLKSEYESLKDTKNWAVYISSPWNKEKVINIMLEILKNYEFKNKNSFTLLDVPLKYKPKVRIVPKKGLSQVVINSLVFSESRHSEFYIPLKFSYYCFAEGGFSSRILRKIRVEMGSTYGVSGVYEVFKKIGYFQISGMVKNEDFSKVVEILNELYRGWKNDGLKEEELNEAKSFYLNAFKTIKDDPLDWGSFLLKNHFFGFPDNYYETLMDEIRNLNLEDILKAHKKFPEEIPYWCFLGDEKIIRQVAEKIGEVEIKGYFDIE